MAEIKQKEENKINKTSIEWVKNPDGTQGYTWNPITGCLNGCEYCYARKLANGRLKSRYLANPYIANAPHDMNDPLWDRLVTDPSYPRFWEDRLYEPFFRQKPSGIFVCDMSDLFGIGIPEGWTSDVVEEIIPNSPQHRFYLLTKQPQNLIKFSPFPDNCWVGVTVTDSLSFHKLIVPFLNKSNYIREVEAPIRFVSFEPLLGSIKHDEWDAILSKDMVDWVIIGAQTKPYKPPKIEWVEEIVRAADKAGVKVFLKNNLKPMFGKMTVKEAVAYGDLNKSYLIEEVSFVDNNNLIAHKLRQEMPSG